MNSEDALNEVRLELRRATEIHGGFVNAHEAFAVLYEEVDELWDEVKKNPRKHPEREERIRQEAVQVAAMALRILQDLC